MIRFYFPLAVSAIVAASPIAHAQAEKTTSMEKTANTATMQKDSDYRASKLIGTTVHNRANENIGEINDLVIGSDQKITAILGVGGFLGMGEHNVAVPMSNLKVTRDGSGWKIVVDGTKEALKSMPAYTYYKS